MKKSVKLLAMLLTLVLVFGAFACVASAAAAEAVVLTGASSVKPGEKYEVKVVAGSDIDFTNIEYTVTFDDTVFTLDVADVVLGDAMPEVSARNLKNDTVKFAGASAVSNDIDADAVFATITFTVKNGLALSGDETAMIKVETKKLNKNGSKVFADGVADDTLYVTVKHEHDYKTKNETESLAPDCDDPGFDRFYCACGEYSDIPVDAKGHEYANQWTPVAGQDNWFENVCSECGDSIKTYVPEEKTEPTYGATVSADKGVFSEEVSAVITAPSDTEKDAVTDLFDDDVSAYYIFKVDFVNGQGVSVPAAAGTEYNVDLDILDTVSDLDYDVAIYNPATGKLDKVSDKVNGNKVSVKLAKGAVLAVYGMEEPVESTPGGSEPKPPVSTGDNSVLPIAITVLVIAVLAAGVAIVLKKKKA
ncbi:MAG: hypothetical protein IKL44_04445 [Clostridia bacterium]|nr:hypothetical protein [Clostridia bacterium]